MRSIIIIGLGFVLWGLFVLAAKALDLVSLKVATVLFVVVWFLAAGFNLWMGVTKAGYSLREELPIFLLIFTLPAAFAVFVKWKWGGV